MKNLMKPLRRVHGIIHEKRQCSKQANRLICTLAADADSLVYYVMTPAHGNLGDHAIACSGCNELARRGITYRELTIDDIALLQRCRKLKVMSGHPIIINGGGNIGTLWPGEDRRIREIIKSCPRSKIICFPSTAYYDDTPKGEKEMKQAKRTFRRHPALSMFARDESTYHIFLEMGIETSLVPDLALLLDKQLPAQDRKKCILCLRSDREHTMDDSDAMELKLSVQKLFGDQVSNSDMFIHRRVPPKDRERVLNDKFMEFRNAALVVTDRLHGMIFAAITATPCIVLDSKSPKIRGCYSWLERLGFIRFANSPSQVLELYREIQLVQAHYDPDRYASEFLPLKKALDSLLPIQKN